MLLIFFKEKLNISLVVFLQSYFKVTKTIKITNKRELQKIDLIHLSDIDFKDFINLYIEYTNKEPYSFLVNDTNLSSKFR